MVVALRRVQHRRRDDTGHSNPPHAPKPFWKSVPLQKRFAMKPVRAGPVIPGALHSNVFAAASEMAPVAGSTSGHPAIERAAMFHDITVSVCSVDER